MKLLFKTLLFLSALGIAGMALASLLYTGLQSGVFQNLLGNVPWAGYSHVVAGSVALILGGVQLSSRLRRRNLGLHRLIGKAYIVCVLISSVGAVVSNLYSSTSWPAKSAFWVLAIVWPAVTYLGYPRSAVFDAKRHGRLLLCSYALTCSAISLRVILISLLMSGTPFRVAYPIAAWGGMLGNLVLLGYVLQRKAAFEARPSV